MLSIHGLELKQTIYNIFSVNLWTLAATPTQKSIHSLKLHFLAFSKILPKAPKNSTWILLLHHPSIILGSLRPSFFNCNHLFARSFFKASSMAELGLNCSKLHWAKVTSPFTLWSLNLHLFRAFASKQQLNLICSSELVRIRSHYFIK